MRITLFILLCCFVLACKPYQDPDPITDPRISNPYCNDPTAINYNWGFPGIPDNSTCIYPADIFEGNYIWRDTVKDGSGNLISFDSVMATVTKIDSTHCTITGRCGSNVNITVNRFLTFYIDSLAGNGQLFCQSTDTIIGTGDKFSLADTSTFNMIYTVVSDTGTTYHESLFIKQ